MQLGLLISKRENQFSKGGKKDLILDIAWPNTNRELTTISGRVGEFFFVYILYIQSIYLRYWMCNKCQGVIRYELIGVETLRKKCSHCKCNLCVMIAFLLRVRFDSDNYFCCVARTYFNGNFLYNGLWISGRLMMVVTWIFTRNLANELLDCNWQSRVNDIQLNWPIVPKGIPRAGAKNDKVTEYGCVRVS